MHNQANTSPVRIHGPATMIGSKPDVGQIGPLAAQARLNAVMGQFALDSSLGNRIIGVRREKRAEVEVHPSICWLLSSY
jgi:hypothetical protein